MNASLRGLVARWKSRVHRSRRERDLDDELQAHLEMLADEYVRQGMTAEEARRQARLHLGGIEQTKEKVRDARASWLDAFAQDLRYAGRTLRKTPAFTFFAVLTLALGIGSATAIFTVAHSVLLRPLPADDPQQLCRLYQERLVDGEVRQSDPSQDNFRDWQARATSFDGMTLFNWPTYNLVGDDRTERVQGMAVSSGFFRVMRVRPFLGREFLLDEYPRAQETRAGFVFTMSAPRAVILSYGLWQRAFGGTRDILGQTVRLSTNELTVVGVMPRDFLLPAVIKPHHVEDGPEFFVPQDVLGNEGRRAGWRTGVARLRQDVSFEQAQSELTRIAGELEREYPEDNFHTTVRLVPLHETVVGDVRPQFRVLGIAVAFVLAIACANVANLLLVRGAGRRRELATRTALGAGRRRLVRQLLTETLVLAVVACAVGLLIAHWSVAAVVRLAPAGLPRIDEVGIDLAVFWFSVLVSLLTVALCGLLPSLQSARLDITVALKDDGPTTMGRRRRWLSNGLVVSETALALVLLIGAGLMLRTFLTLHRVEPGFSADRRLTIGFNASERDVPRGRSFYRTLVERVEALPGVEAAAIGGVPMAVGISSRAQAEGGRAGAVDCGLSAVTEHYFQALDIGVAAGRVFAPSDDVQHPPVAVVTRSMAARLWPDAEAVGARLAFGTPGKDRWASWITVVGVVEDTTNEGLEKVPRPVVYVPLWQNTNTDPNNMIVRTAGDPLTVLPAIRSLVRRIDKGRALTRVATLDDRWSALLAPRRFNLVVVGAFSVIAFVLAVVGVYAVVSHTVTLRVREIGVRVVLGASPVHVLAMIARQNAWLIILGEAIGVVVALALNRAFETMVFGVTTTDAGTYVTTGVLFAAVALLACSAPAGRASRIDPLSALRSE